ncbi:MAG: hypothetical protein HGA86_04155, partial [Anaerolineaceae bacterium]|nr:hypothetical protein [Anaerolineaceae bacterium]
MKKGFFVIVLILSVLLSGCGKAAATPSTQELYSDKSGGQGNIPGAPMEAPAMEAPRAADGYDTSTS